MNYASNQPPSLSGNTRPRSQGLTAHEMSTLSSRTSFKSSVAASVKLISHQVNAFTKCVTLHALFEKNLTSAGVDGPTSNDEKPIGCMRRICTSFRENLYVLLRTLGLGILSALRFRRRKTRGEPIKVAIQHSRLTALVRTLIHAIPIGTALWLITLNWNTYYVGSYTYNLFYHQVGAKVLEIMIQASLTAIIFSYIRHEMVMGNGLPFGALFSGLQISQISYLWSKEFWGSLTSSHLPWKRKASMLVMTLVCFVLAAAAGPSSATRLIPRLDYWPAGVAQIWINATQDELWPTILDASSVPSPYPAPSNCSFLPHITFSDGCPASEWTAAFLDFQMGAYSYPHQVDNLIINDFSPTESIQVTGQNSVRQLSEDLGQALCETIPDSREAQISYTTVSTSFTQHAAVADALTNTAALWTNAIKNAKPPKGHGASLFDEQEAVHTLENSYEPHVRVFCGSDTIQGPNDSTPVYFPALPWEFDPTKNSTDQYYLADGVLAKEFSLLDKKQLFSLSGSTLSSRIKWVQIPPDYNNASSLGIVIVLPPEDPSPSQNTTQEAILCRIEAAWGLSTMNVSTTGSIFSKVSSLPNLSGVTDSILRQSNANWENALRSPDLHLDASLYENRNSPFVWVDGVWPSIPITLTPEWAECLNPVIPSLNETVLNILLYLSEEVVGHPDAKRDPLTAARTVLSLLTANAIARASFYSEFRGVPKTVPGPHDSVNVDGTAWLYGKQNVFSTNPEEGKNWTQFQVTSTIKGYAYNTHGFGPKVAIAFLLTYCVTAFVHVFYSGISGISSTAWDSIAEVTALAVNSTPTTALRNTCAGITEMHVFRTPVRILALMDSEGESEHLEMVFGRESSEDDVHGRTIKANRAYGTLSAMLKKVA